MKLVYHIDYDTTQARSQASTRGRITCVLRHSAFSTDKIYMPEPPQIKLLVTHLIVILTFEKSQNRCFPELLSLHSKSELLSFPRPNQTTIFLNANLRYLEILSSNQV